eukprot:TRINITY_DN841_c0_g1_i5.p1 TRINITY_DN841_c0_g1~~TRINITY_DN841_c0_g1_i5.p1  ORF type:complete len:1767 (+),score=406.96 TRINITY_DN841_c0_g1_i5:701-5302(+)
MLFMTLTVFDECHAVTFMYDFRRSWSFFATSSGRMRLLWLAGKVALSLTEALLLYRSRAAAIAHVCAVLAVAQLLLWAHIYTQLYYSRRTNWIEAGAMCGFNWLSICAVIAATTPSMRFVFFLVAVGGLAPSFALGPALCAVRMRILRWRMRRCNWAQQKKIFRIPLLYDIATKFVYNRKTSEDDLQMAEQIFKHGLWAFPKSAFLRLCYAAFLIEVRGDTVGVKHQLEQACHRCRVLPDLSYIIYCFEQSMDGRESTRCEREMDLHIAKRHAIIAKKKLVEFWSVVGRQTTGDTDPGTTGDSVLFALVRSIDFHENAAREIFAHLMVNESTNPTVLRTYGHFLYDICDSREQADELFALADQCEESSALESAKERRSSEHDGTEGDDDSYARGELSEGAGESVEVEQQRRVSTDREKVLEYRKRLLHFRTGAVSVWTATQVSGLIVLTLLAGGLFGALFWHSSGALATLRGSRRAADALYGVAHGALGARCLQRGCGAGSDPAVPTLEAQLRSIAAAMHDWARCRGAGVDSAVSVIDYCPNNGANVLPTPAAHCVTGVYTTRQTSLWQAAATTGYCVNSLLHLRSVASAGECNDTSLRFVLDNYVQSLAGDLRDVPLCYIAGPADEADDRSAAIIAAVLFAAVLVVVCILTVVYLPIRRKIASERKLIMRLFYDIPKSTITNMISRYSEIENEGQVLPERSGRTVTSLGRVGVAYFVSVTATFCLCTALFALTVMSVSLCKAIDKNQLLFANALSLNAIQIKFLSNELVYGDTTTWTTPEISSMMELLVNDSFTQLDHLVHLHDSRLYETLFETPCSSVELGSSDNSSGSCDSASNVSLTCTGLAEVLTQFLRSSIEFLRLDHHSANTSSFQSAHAAFGVADSWLVHCLHVTYDKYRGGPTGVRIAGEVLFPISLFTTCVFLVLTWFMVPSVIAEYSRLVQLLLTLPPNVLLRQGAAKQLLESGGFTAATRETLSESYRGDRRSRALLDVSTDAVVATDAEGHVAIFNPAAEALFGRAASDAIGRDIDVLFTPQHAKDFRAAIRAWKKARKLQEITRRYGSSSSIGDEASSSAEGSSDGGGEDTLNRVLVNKEMMMVHRTGFLIPVLISTSVASLDKGAAVFASFIKDIRNLKQREEELELEKQRADHLLENILPASVIGILKEHGSVPAQKYNSVTILFADICSFTPLSAKMDPEGLVSMLNDMFSAFDYLCDRFQVEKVKTIGDAFMAATGVPTPCEDHAQRMINFAVALTQSLRRLNKKKHWEPAITMRVGVNTGSVVAGVIGTRRFQYDMWGDAVNLAARLESSGVPGKIHVGPVTYELLRDQFNFTSRGFTHIKGKGEMPTYLLDVPDQPLASPEPQAAQASLPPVLLTEEALELACEQRPKFDFPRLLSRMSWGSVKKDESLCGVGLGGTSLLAPGGVGAGGISTSSPASSCSSARVSPSLGPSHMAFLLQPEPRTPQPPPPAIVMSASVDSACAVDADADADADDGDDGDTVASLTPDDTPLDTGNTPPPPPRLTLTVSELPPVK